MLISSVVLLFRFGEWERGCVPAGVPTLKSVMRVKQGFKR
ncbi:hypothetical protein A2U01_0110376, partial [Trifolium medium]|nr:hypothetical protein [Trifolium medium]